MQQHEATTQPSRVVIPVRYVCGDVVQTTSSELSAEAIHVRAVVPPRIGLVIDLQLYFPNFGETVRTTAVVVQAETGHGFWAELAGGEDGGDRIMRFLATHRDAGDRGCRRFPTYLRASVVENGNSTDGCVTNLSRSGAFVKTERPPPPGRVVELKMAIPGAPGRETSQAYVVHAVDRVGVGVQFIGGNDRFRWRVDEYVARLAA